MYKYKVTINGNTIGLVYADNSIKALEKAVMEFGLDCDVEQY